MKKRYKLLIGILVLFFTFGAATFALGSTTHTYLKGEINTKLETFMDQYSEKNDFHGVVLVAKEGEILFTKAYGLANREENIPNLIDTKFHIASLTKSFTALAILQLEEQGLLSTDDYVVKYLPDYPNGEKIKIHHLLSNSSGIPEYFVLEDLDKTLDYSLDDLIILTRDHDLLYEPGTNFNYSNSNFAIAGKIIELVSGKSYHDYIQHHIFDVAGMNNSSLVYLPGADVALGYTSEGGKPEPLNLSIATAAGNIISTAEDLLKYDRAMKHEILISKEQRDKMESQYVDSAPLGVVGYGYGWYIADSFLSFNKKAVVHAGGINGYRADFERYLEDDVTVIVFKNHEGGNLGQLSRELVSIVLDLRYWFWHKLV